jgi:hypothetical protein
LKSKKSALISSLRFLPGIVVDAEAFTPPFLLLPPLRRLEDENGTCLNGLHNSRLAS